jgi:hypothetical protein
MKTKKIILSFLMVFALASCKNETEKKEGDKNQAELKETFDVNFNLIVTKDDTFKLYYTEDGTLNFGDDRAVLCVVKGSVTPQDLLFKLPADVLPTQVRLDFGDNVEQEDVIMNSMKFKYLKNVYEKTFGAGEDITHYFYPLEAQIKIDDATKTVKLLKAKGQIHDPLMWSNQLLSDEMVKLYKN